MYFGSGRAVIRIIDCKTGMVLGSVNLENEKEAGATYDHAGRKLLEKMSKNVADVVLQEMQKALE